MAHLQNFVSHDRRARLAASACDQNKISSFRLHWTSVQQEPRICLATIHSCYTHTRAPPTCGNTNTLRAPHMNQRFHRTQFHLDTYNPRHIRRSENTAKLIPWRGKFSGRKLRGMALKLSTFFQLQKESTGWPTNLHTASHCAISLQVSFSTLTTQQKQLKLTSGCWVVSAWSISLLFLKIKKLVTLIIVLCPLHTTPTYRIALIGCSVADHFARDLTGSSSAFIPHPALVTWFLTLSCFSPRRGTR